MNRITVKNTVTVTAGIAIAGSLMAGMVVRSSGAVFTASDSNTANSMATGTVGLTDSAAGAALFDSSLLGNLDGGQAVTRCITVTYASNLPASDTRDVRLYLTQVNPTVAGKDLAPYLGLAVTSAAAPSTGSVAPDCVSTAGGQVPFSSLTGASLISPAAATFASARTANSTYAGGFTGWTVPGNGGSRVFRITSTVANDQAAQGLGTTADLVWEAR